jgi:hypothetical protein
MFEYTILCNNFKSASLTFVDQIESKVVESHHLKVFLSGGVADTTKSSDGLCKPRWATHIIYVQKIMRQEAGSGNWHRRITPAPSKRKFCDLRIHGAHQVSILIAPMGLVISLIHSLKSSIRVVVRFVHIFL